MKSIKSLKSAQLLSSKKNLSRNPKRSQSKNELISSSTYLTKKKKETRIDEEEEDLSYKIK